MFGFLAQLFSIVFLHDFNPALTPGLAEDFVLFEPAYMVMNLVEACL